MSRTLRGLWSRRATLLPLLLLTTTVVAGVVAVTGFAAAAGTSVLLAVPLVLLGLVAVPATGRELAIARRGEVALARLRGVEDGALYALLLAEPLAVLLLGGSAGLGLGALGTELAARTWIDVPTSGVGADAVVAGAGVVLVSLLAVLIGMAGALREPLADQVRAAGRPRAAGLGALFFDVLVVVAAGVAVYRSGAGSSEDPDLLVLAGPAILGLAVGQVLVWVVLLLARAGVGLTARRGLAGFLAVRRLARIGDAVSSLRVLVAAAVVGALAVTAATQVAEWTDDAARLRATASVQVPVDDQARAALELTRELDPDGQWLMAAVVVPGEGSVPARRVFLDTSRFERVAGDFLDPALAAPISARLDDLRDVEVPVADGDTVSVTVRGVSSRSAGVLRPRVRLDYVDSARRGRTVRFAFELPLDGAARSATEPLPGCAQGCVLRAVTLRRTPGDSPLPWLVSGIDLGGLDGLGAMLTPDPPPLAGEDRPTFVDGGLLAGPTFAPLTARADEQAVGEPTPVLATDSAVWEGAPVLETTGGVDRPAALLDRLPALPLVERDGVLADLPSSLVADLPTVPAARVMVLARADTPARVLAELTDRTGTEPVTFADVARTFAGDGRAAQAQVYALMAGFCLLAALLVLAAAAARQRGAWLRDVAALRVVGLGARPLRRAGLVEVAWLGAAAVLATAFGSWAAVRLLLANLALVEVPEHALLLRTDVDVVPILGATVTVALLVVVVVGRARSLGADRSRPAILREETV